MKENYIVKTKCGNYYYLYQLNNNIHGVNILKRKVKHSRSLNEIEKEGIITYWSSGVYHSFLNLIKLPKRIFIFLLNRKNNNLCWVKHNMVWESK